MLANSNISKATIRTTNRHSRVQRGKQTLKACYRRPGENHLRAVKRKSPSVRVCDAGRPRYRLTRTLYPSGIRNLEFLILN